MKKNEKSKQNENPFAKKAPYNEQNDRKSVHSEELFQNNTQESGESVKVALRLRPLNELQLSRGDDNCIRQESDKTIQINFKSTLKNFRFNHILGEAASQQSVFQQCNINEFIDEALEGYSATVFAYGQTGSGKTYTMAGKEEIFNNQIYQGGESEGIIPRAIKLLWNKISSRKQSFFIKASYTEIYNQQIKDLLNLSSGILHCRWNPTNGFFVEDLIVVDCSNVDDMIAVLNEGMKNRKSASHELNKDSSRSHSILTMYMISEFKSGNQVFKKYGKLSFVDLAGSERLKESKSQGDMIKQTGNINKSLFTLGKVIKGLSDKKSKTPYIPYRDSKLTMLLMDSLGGNSKALMIACVSPSSAYFDETLSTLNYAARTMNIKNKPVIQMEQKDQKIMTILKQIQILKKQNIYLRQQFQRFSIGLPLKAPSEISNSSKRANNNNSKLSRTLNIQNEIVKSGLLPPLQKSKDEIYHSSQLNSEKQLGVLKSKQQSNNIILDYQNRFQIIKKENEDMRKSKAQSEQLYQQIMNANSNLRSKLENLEQVFLNKKKDQKPTEQLITSSLMQENTQLKHRLEIIQKTKREISYKMNSSTQESLTTSLQLKEQNEELQKQIEYLQKRQRDLLDMLQKKK